MKHCNTNIELSWSGGCHGIEHMCTHQSTSSYSEHVHIRDFKLTFYVVYLHKNNNETNQTRNLSRYQPVQKEVPTVRRCPYPATNRHRDRRTFRPGRGIISSTTTCLYPQVCVGRYIHLHTHIPVQTSTRVHSSTTSCGTGSKFSTSLQTAETVLRRACLTKHTHTHTIITHWSVPVDVPCCTYTRHTDTGVHVYYRYELESLF